MYNKQKLSVVSYVTKIDMCNLTPALMQKCFSTLMIFLFPDILHV